MNKVQVGQFVVGDGQPCLIVAEIGINHNGDLGTVFRLIDEAVGAGCNAVKFQKRTVSVVFSPAELAKPRPVHASILQAALDRGVLNEEAVQRLRSSEFQDSTNGDLKFALEFTVEEYRQIDAHCKRHGIMWSVSPWDEQAVDDVREFRLPFIKIASASLTDDALLKKARSLGVPVILSTGMSTAEQVVHAVGVLGQDDLVLLHTVSTYPAEDQDLNLGVISTLRSIFPDVPVGYSGHEKGTTLCVCAVALGACVIERHITLERTMPGSDHSASLEPEGIRRVVSNIRRLEKAMGNGIKDILDAEKPIMGKLRRV